MAQLWFWEGHYARRGIDLRRHYHPEPLIVTDLDLLAYDFSSMLRRSKTIGEVKSGKSKNAPKPLDRIIWL
ncbi:MAG: DNA-binding response regulator, partial [Acidimicrobiales bacterium]